MIALNAQIIGLMCELCQPMPPQNVMDQQIRKTTSIDYLKRHVKNSKHQKLMVNGDFNATTAVSLDQTFYEGKKCNK